MKNNSLKKFYKENGYFIYKINKKVIINLRKEFISIFNLISKGNIRKKIKNDNDIIKLYKSKNRNLWTSVYDIIKLHPGIFAISNQKHLEKILNIAGIEKPCFGTRPQVRVDMPNDAKFSFQSHQDYPFNLGSKNSITLWMPLQDTDYKMGTLKVSEKSHRTEKIYKYGLNNKKFDIDVGKLVKRKVPANHHYKVSLNDKLFNFKSIKVKAGEALVISQFLVHKSGKNLSDKIRFSVQLRYTDLAEKDYIKRKYFLYYR